VALAAGVSSFLVSFVLLRLAGTTATLAAFLMAISPFPPFYHGTFLRHSCGLLAVALML
jgi:hypothetical protein